MGASCSSPKGGDIIAQGEDDEDMYATETDESEQEDEVGEEDSYYRGPVLVMYDTVTLLPSWKEWSGPITVQASAQCESANDGSPRGHAAAWEPHEVLPGQVICVGKPLCLGCCREESLVLRLTVTVSTEDTRDAPGNTTVVTGSLLLDQVPLKNRISKKSIMSSATRTSSAYVSGSS